MATYNNVYGIAYLRYKTITGDTVKNRHFDSRHAYTYICIADSMSYTTCDVMGEIQNERLIFPKSEEAAVSLTARYYTYFGGSMGICTKKI